jgi:hypothetical protein
VEVLSVEIRTRERDFLFRRFGPFLAFEIIEKNTLLYYNTR